MIKASVYLFGLAFLLSAAQSVGAVKIEVKTVHGSGRTEIVTIDSARLAAVENLRHVGDLSKIPPDAWERMSPEQIEKLAKVAMVMGARKPLVMKHIERDEGPGEAPIIPIFGIVFSFSSIVLIVFFIGRHRRATAHEEYELRRAMVEKGVFDPAMVAPRTQKAPRTARMMIWGLVLSLGGLGLTIAGVLEDGIEESGFELAVMLTGVALIIAAQYLTRQAKDEALAGATSDVSEPVDYS